MATLLDALPELVGAIEVALGSLGRGDIGTQLREVALVRWTYDDSCDAAYLYLRSPRTLNAVDERIIGVKHGETIPVHHDLSINLDTDNHGRLSGIEILGAKDIVSRLAGIAARNGAVPGRSTRSLDSTRTSKEEPQ